MTTKSETNKKHIQNKERKQSSNKEKKQPGHKQSNQQQTESTNHTEYWKKKHKLINNQTNGTNNSRDRTQKSIKQDTDKN